MEESSKQQVLKFDAAMSLTGFGCYNFRMTLLCGLIAMSMVLETIGFGYIIPAAQCDLNLTLADKGWIGAIPFMGLILSSQFWGYIADTKGRKSVLMVSMTLGSIFSIISSFSPNLATFALFKLISTATMSAANVVIFAFYGEFTPKMYVDSMLSILSSIIIFSQAIASLIAWAILSFDFLLPINFLGITFRPWRLLVICYASPFLLSTFCLFWSPESPKYLMGQGKDEEALVILRNMYHVNTKKDPSTYAVDALVLDDMDHLKEKLEGSLLYKLWRQTAPLFIRPHLKYIMIFFVLNFGVYASTSSFIIWLPDIADRFLEGLESKGADDKVFCDLMSVRTEREAAAKLNHTVTPVCDDSLRVTTYPMMLSVTLVVGCSNVVLAICLRWVSKRTCLQALLSVGCLATLSIHWIRNPWLAWTCLVVFQCCGILRGVLLAYGVELFPTNYRAMAMCLLLIFGRVGVITGTNLVGYLMEVYCPANFIGFGILLGVCLIFCTLLPGKEHPQSAARRSHVELPPTISPIVSKI